jgi:hypothetical protein
MSPSKAQLAQYGRQAQQSAANVKAATRLTEHRPQLVTRTGDRKLAQTDIQRFLQEEQERQARKQELIQELLLERDRQMAEFEEQLSLLGYRADVVGKSSGATKEAGDKRERKRSETCNICGFATRPAHDGRLKAHRDQGDNKTALTDGQLEAANLKRV